MGWTDIIILVIFFVAIAIVLVKIRNANRREYLDNKRIAKDLNWKINYYYPTQHPYGNEYFFFERYALDGGFSYSFNGIYQNQQIVLLPFKHFRGKDTPPQNYLIAELKETKHKNFDILILSKAESDLDYKGLMFNKYYKVKLEGNEFNQNFVVYSLQPDAPFYQLAPDAMARLIDLKQSYFSDLAIQVKQNSVLIAADNQTFINYMNTVEGKTDRKDIYLGFLGLAFEINKLLI